MFKRIGKIFLFLVLAILSFISYSHLSNYTIVEIEDTQEFISKMEEYFKKGEYGYAKLFADFILGEGIFSEEEKYIAKEYKNRILKIEDSILYRAKSFLKGFLTGEADDLMSITGAAVADTFIWGDIRDLVIEGYKAVTNQDYSKLTLALSTIGILTTAIPHADTSVSILKVFTKIGAINKEFLKFLIKTIKKGNPKVLKRIFKSVYEGFKYTKKYGLKIYAELFSLVKTEKDLHKLVELLKVNGTARTYVALKYLRVPLSKIKKFIKFKVAKLRFSISRILDFLLNFIIEFLSSALGKILSLLSFLVNLILFILTTLALLLQILRIAYKLFKKTFPFTFLLRKRGKNS